MDGILKVDKGTFGYGDDVLFRDIDFELGDSEILTILGPNGAGKTTLLKCVMGILKWKQGRSELNGKDIRSYSPKELSRVISYVPQMKGTSFDYSVEEMIMMGRSPHIRLYESPSDKDWEIVDGYIERMGISRFRKRNYNTLSGGEMQLVMIARALVSQPTILVLDEPESNLDYYNQLKILDLIEDVSKDMSCVINTHYPEHALRISDKTLMLDSEGGHLYGRTEDVVTEDNLERVFGVRTIMGSVERDSMKYQYIIPTKLR